MENILTIALALIFLLPLLSKNSNNNSLRPFEFSDFSEENTRGSENMPYERAVIILLLTSSIASIVYFTINYLQTHGSTFDYETTLKPMYAIIGGITNLMILIVALTVRLTKWRNTIISMVLIEVGIYIYYTFFQ